LDLIFAELFFQTINRLLSIHQLFTLLNQIDWASYIKAKLQGFSKLVPIRFPKVVRNLCEKFTVAFYQHINDFNTLCL